MIFAVAFLVEKEKKRKKRKEYNEQKEHEKNENVLLIKTLKNGKVMTRKEETKDCQLVTII